MAKSLEIDPRSIKAGRVAFNFLNDGNAQRDAIILKTDKTSNVLQAGLNPSEAAKMPRSGLIPAGGALTYTLQLARAHYVLICTDPTHKQVITYTSLDVR